VSERSITGILFDLGVTHERDAASSTDGCHKLFYAGRCIGRYSAFECCRLIKEYGVGDEDDVTVYPDGAG
jgi:hypothetical protein